MNSNYGSVKKDKREWKKGFVVFLDCLGVRDLNVEKTDDFLDRYNLILERLPIIIAKAQTQRNSNILPIENFEVSLLNDLIIMCIESDNGNRHNIHATRVLIDYLDVFYYIGLILSGLFKLGIKNQIPFRGAISYGHFIRGDPHNSQNTIRSAITLGPAISEAAMWYEQANWLGIKATSQLGSLINSWVNGVDSKYRDLTPAFVKYDVPLKNCKAPRLWCLNWPREYLRDVLYGQIAEKNIDSVDSLYRADMDKIAYPPEASVKYHNTDLFYNFIKNNDLEFLKFAASFNNEKSK